jgi:hypothetical protein
MTTHLKTLIENNLIFPLVTLELKPNLLINVLENISCLRD